LICCGAVIGFALIPAHALIWLDTAGCATDAETTGVGMAAGCGTVSGAACGNPDIGLITFCGVATGSACALCFVCMVGMEVRF